MKKSLAVILLMLGVSILTIINTGRTNAQELSESFRLKGASAEAQNVWQRAERSFLTDADSASVRLNKTALAALLAAAPSESVVPLRQSETILSLPMPDGSFADFRIQEAPVLELEMAIRFPEIKSYRLLGVADGTMTGRFDLTPQGFHATILSDSGVINILPAEVSGANVGGLDILRGGDFEAELYTSSKPDEMSAKQIEASCKSLARELADETPVERENIAPNVALGPTLRTYRIAIGTTWEYTDKFGGRTVAGTVASLNTWLNGANVFFERELAVRMLLVNNTNIIFSADRGFNANNDPYTNNSDALLIENGGVLRDRVGIENYNIGHVLGDGSGRDDQGNSAFSGVAQLGVVCSNRLVSGVPEKGAAFSRVVAPVGNASAINLFVHELAHQFGARHTHNAASCDGRTPNNGYEPGGGDTIMAYQGSCGVNAYGPPYDTAEYFHSRSIAQMTDHVVNGNGSACPMLTNTGNSAPVLTAPAAFNIPKQTPFVLTAAANDPDAGDNNNLTYTWEQYQAGGNLYPNPAFSDAGDPVTTTRPILRGFAPTINPSRTFPSLQYILNNANIPPDVVRVPQPEGVRPAFLERRSGESLPQVARTLEFRVTARDNVGGVNDATTVLTVDGNSGPFRVTAPNTAVTLAGGSMQTVTWDVAGTTNAPVSAANVKISLSIDGGQTFPFTLAASVPNNGTSNVMIPNGIASTAARIKIEAVGNIFFDISDANLTVTRGGTCPAVNDVNPKLTAVGQNVVITGVNFTGVTAVRFSNNVNAQTFTVNSDTQLTATVPAGAIGGAINLVKPGCNDTPTSEITVCAGAPVTLSVDNGQVNSSRGNGSGTVFIVNRLTPAAYPATLNAVVVALPDAGDLPPGVVVNIVAGARPNGGTDINNTLFQRIPFTLPADRTGFQTYRVAPVTINSGDFVVGYSYVQPTNAQYFGANIDGSPNQGRSYNSRGGEFFVESNAAGNYMIRAEIFNNCTATVVCNITINPATQNIPGTGGNGTVNINAPANCPWTAIRSARWITFTSAPNGSGSGTLNFTAAPNDTTVRRTTTIQIGDKTFTVTQEGGTAPNCNYVLNPAAANLAAAASAGNAFAVAVANGCAWTAATTDNWINITGGANGNGNGTVTYSLAANPNNAARTGKITVAGQTFTITQAGAAPVCNYALNPAEANLPAAAAAGNNFAVNVGAGCAWTAITADNWINITAGTGNGNGTVTFSVAANASTTEARVGTIVVNGQAFRVNQALAVANCNYALNPTGFLAIAGASEGNNFAVATAAGCQWTATANQNWINVTGGAASIGNGTVTYSLQANPSETNARIGTITAAGQTFTVRQPAANQPCLPVDGNLLNWYRGEQNLFDAIGANDGAAQAGNIAYAADGRFGQAFRFDGAASTSIQRQISDNFSIEFWVRTQSAGGANDTDWTQGAGLVGNDEFGVSLGNGRILFGVGNATVTSANTVNDNQWHHVVATRNRETGALRLYVDGNLPPDNAIGGTQSLNAAAGLIFGRRGANGAFYNGDLDEVKIFDNEQDENQVLTGFFGCEGALPRLEINNVAAGEGDPNQNGEFSTAVFTVRLSAPIEQDVVVEYATQDITATEGVDYVGSSGTLLISAGETSASIFVPLISDLSNEPDRQFSVVLFEPANAGLNDDEGIGTIVDDDSLCEFLLSEENAALSASATDGNAFDVFGADGCAWTATTDQSWITITDVSSPNGDGSVTYSAAANTGEPRTGYIAVAGQLFEVFQAAIPAKVTIGGRVFDSEGGGLAKAKVTLTDADGAKRVVRTNAFGYYRFFEVEADQTIIVSAASRRFSYMPQTVDVLSVVENLDFTPLP